MQTLDEFFNIVPAANVAFGYLYGLVTIVFMAFILKSGFNNRDED